jgi:hemerythrin-like domain-containing protein
MKRDVRLWGLSSDHHSALALARSLAVRAEKDAPDAAIAVDLVARFSAELEPHFRIEEEALLPALLALGEVGLSRRTADEHAALRHAVAAIASGDLAQILDFAGRLVAHVRFEERELFPCCEQRLSDEVLAEVQRRRPSPGGRADARGRPNGTADGATVADGEKETPPLEVER